jgi:hypothetical protein
VPQGNAGSGWAGRYTGYYSRLAFPHSPTRSFSLCQASDLHVNRWRLLAGDGRNEPAEDFPKDAGRPRTAGAFPRLS